MTESRYHENGSETEVGQGQAGSSSTMGTSSSPVMTTKEPSNEGTPAQPNGTNGHAHPALTPVAAVASSSSSSSQPQAQAPSGIEVTNRHPNGGIGPQSPTLQASEAEVWHLKEIRFRDRFHDEKKVKVITQNYNGPCSLIAICNILILRGDIIIEPENRQTVSYELLCQLVGEYLLTSRPEVDVSAALSILPHTQKGMDLNPQFTGSTSFKRSSTNSGELDLFKQVGINLVHGWLVDPQSPEAVAVAKTQDYDSAVNLVVEVDHITKGNFVVHDDHVGHIGYDTGSGHGAGSASGSSSAAGGSGAGSSGLGALTYTDEEKAKIEDAILVRQFLDTTKSQMTYHGLFSLAHNLQPGALVALYRNLHLSVLHKPWPASSTETSSSATPSSSSNQIPSISRTTSSSNGTPSDDSLYCLVTDHVFLNEPSVVWERLEDVDGGWSTFVDHQYRKSSPAGGDWSGHTAEDIVRAMEQELAISDPTDLALAQQLQAEENNRAAYVRMPRPLTAAEMHSVERQRRKEIDRQIERERKERKEQERRERREQNGGKKDCIIM